MHGSLSARLERALRLGEPALSPLADAAPDDERDALQAMMAIHDLHMGSIDRLGDTVRWQHHPAVAALKGRLEAGFLADLPVDTVREDEIADPAATVAAMRRTGRDGVLPEVYDWIATEASWDEIVRFLAVEGGPDAGFDDLVAICQVGLAGEPKLELARNYWDEMGRGRLEGIHTEMHHRLCRAVELPAIPRDEQPLSGLRRNALGNVLATNRWLQPELVGALGLLELQAGPRCRKVVAGLERHGASHDALEFYQEHAEVDPHHGKGWVDNVVAPLAEDREWARRMLQGARWRSTVNAAFFADMAERFVRKGELVASSAA